MDTLANPGLRGRAFVGDVAAPACQGEPLQKSMIAGASQRGKASQCRKARETLGGRAFVHIMENPGLRGRAFVDALASLGDMLEDGPRRNTRGRAFVDILQNPSLRGRAFVDALASLGAILENWPSWAQLEPT